jgi:hypothetical protein
MIRVSKNDFDLEDACSVSVQKKKYAYTASFERTLLRDPKSALPGFIDFRPAPYGILVKYVHQSVRLTSRYPRLHRRGRHIAHTVRPWNNGEEHIEIQIWIRKLEVI